MSAYAPAARTAVPQFLRVSLAASPATSPATVRQPTSPSQSDREARRREIERAERQRAQAERVRDNLAARHPLSLR